MDFVTEKATISNHGRKPKAITKNESGYNLNILVELVTSVGPSTVELKTLRKCKK